MKKTNKIKSIIFVLVFLSCISIVIGQNRSSNNPLFTQFFYKGNDKIYSDNPLNIDEFYTPILQGCYPDPSICRKGNDYFLVCSSFAMFPGIPIFHSTDLVNWKQIGHVLDRKSQLKIQNIRISEGIYAPAIRYNKHNDTFYLITTNVGSDGNIIVKTKDPFLGWSDPIKLDFNGIDPSLFFDDDGKAYIVHNDAPDAGKTLYDGHRVIKVREYDLENDLVIPGTDKIVVNGGVNISDKPIWIEAPHIYKKNKRYYLICAEGGTGDWHSEVVFFSDSLKGPFTPANNNPILTQRYLKDQRQNKVIWSGHADIIEENNERFVAVFLASRPNELNRVNIGRETFILPVDWGGNFPIFVNGLIPLSPKLKMPKDVVNKTGQEGFFPNGNFTFKEDFTSNDLDYRWIGVRGPREDFISISEKGGLTINPLSVNIQKKQPTSTLFYRQQHNSFETSVILTYKPKSEKHLAGMVIYQSESFNYVFGITKKNNDYYILLQRTDNGKSKLIVSEKIEVNKPIKLHVIAEGDKYKFNYSVDNNLLKNIGGEVSGDILSTNKAGGFTGTLIGLYATSDNNTIP